MSIKIFLTNLAAYNEGELIGKRIELPLDEDELKTKIEEILRPGEEELFITDYECPYFAIDEYENIDKLNEWSARIQALLDEGKTETEIKAVFKVTHGEDVDYTLEVLSEENYILYHDVRNEEELGHALVEGGFFAVELPDEVVRYLDYEAIGRDAVANGVVILRDIGVAVRRLD